MKEEEYIFMKQQAKQLLLRGCYKMAISKYKYILSNPPIHITPREMSTLYLNQGICYQFVQNLDAALELIQISIKTDPTYEKAYYRRLQVCRELKRYQQALSVPLQIRNKQIDLLLIQTKDEYIKYLQDSQYQKLEQGISNSIKDQNQEMVNDINKVILKKFSESPKLKDEIQSGIFRKYWVLISGASNKRFVQMYYQMLYLLLKERRSIKMGQQWWKQNLKLILNHNVFLSLSKIMRLCPYFEIKQVQKNCMLSDFLRHLGIDDAIKSLPNFLILLNQQVTNNHIGQSSQLDALLSTSINILQQILSLGKIQEFQLSWSITKMLLQFKCEKQNIGNKIVQGGQFETLIFHLYDTLKKCKQSGTQILETDTNLVQQLILSVLNKSTGIANLYILNQILMRLKFNPSNFSPIISETLDKVQKPQNQIQELLLHLIKAKVNPSIFTSEQVKRILSTKYSNQQLLLELINTLCITNRNNLILILKSDYIKTIYNNNSLNFQKLKVKGALVSTLYLLIVDTTEIKTLQIAEKMGVSIEEIAAARKLQNSKDQMELQSRIKQGRSSFLSNNIQSILSLLQKLLEPSTQLITFKISSVISSISKTYTKLFYSSSFIEFMISQSKNIHSEKQVFQFFASICKQCNPQVLLFKHKQLIVNILTEALQKSGHELIIFESLLGIINLLPETQADIKRIIKLLYEQNEYIVHAVLNIANNCLIKGKQYFQKLSEKDVQLILIYYRNYTTIKNQGTTKNIQDYSHPQRIYSTIISLLMVLSEYKKLDIAELYNLQSLILSCKVLPLRQRSTLIGKGLMYFANQGTLSKKELDCLKEQIQWIRSNDHQLYSQIRKLL